LIFILDKYINIKTIVYLKNSQSLIPSKLYKSAKNMLL